MDAPIDCSTGNARFPEDKRVVISFLRLLFATATVTFGPSLAEGTASAKFDTGLQTVTHVGWTLAPLTEGRARGLDVCSSSVRAFVEARGRSFRCTDSLPLMKVSG